MISMQRLLLEATAPDGYHPELLPVSFDGSVPHLIDVHPDWKTIDTEQQTIVYNTRHWKPATRGAGLQLRGHYGLTVLKPKTPEAMKLVRDIKSEFRGDYWEFWAEHDMLSYIRDTLQPWLDAEDDEAVMAIIAQGVKLLEMGMPPHLLGKLGVTQEQEEEIVSRFELGWQPLDN